MSTLEEQVNLVFQSVQLLEKEIRDFRNKIPFDVQDPLYIELKSELSNYNSNYKSLLLEQKNTKELDLKEKELNIMEQKNTKELDLLKILSEELKQFRIHNPTDFTSSTYLTLSSKIDLAKLNSLNNQNPINISQPEIPTFPATNLFQSPNAADIFYPQNPSTLTQPQTSANISQPQQHPANISQPHHPANIFQSQHYPANMFQSHQHPANISQPQNPSNTSQTTNPILDWKVRMILFYINLFIL